MSVAKHIVDFVIDKVCVVIDSFKMLTKQTFELLIFVVNAFYDKQH